MKCTHCGSEYEGGQFCTACGNKNGPEQISPAPAPAPSPAPVKKKLPGCVVALIVVGAVLAALLIGILLIGGLLTPTNSSIETPAPVQTPAMAAADPTGDASPGTPVPEEPEEMTDVIIGEVAQLKGMALQVTGVEKSQGSDFDKPREGMEYVIVTVVIKNVSSSTISYNPYYFTMQNSQGQITETAFTIQDTDTALSSGELVPGGVVTGTVAFEQPKGDSALTFIYEDVSWFSDKKLTVDLSQTAQEFVPLAQEALAPVEGAVALGQEGTLDSAAIVVNEVQRSAGDGFMDPKEGMEYISVNVTIRNTGTDTLDYNPLYFKIRNSQGQVVSMSITGFDQERALQSGELAGGGTVTGSIVFEIPKDDPALILLYQSNIFTSETLAFTLS